MEKFRISIIDFMMEHGKHEVGKDVDGVSVCLGDMVRFNGDDDWFVMYRYGKFVLKKIGITLYIRPDDFSVVQKLNAFGSGSDWLIIGYTNEPFYENVRHIEGVEIVEVI